MDVTAGNIGSESQYKLSAVPSMKTATNSSAQVFRGPANCIHRLTSVKTTEEKKMARIKLRPGEGCEFTCLKKRIHPQKKVQKRYPDYNKRDDKLDGCLMMREGIKITSGKMRKVFFFTHIELPDEEIHIIFLRKRSNPTKRPVRFRAGLREQTSRPTYVRIYYFSLYCVWCKPLSCFGIRPRQCT